MTRLAVETLTVRRGACPVVDGVTLTVEDGEFVGLIGPNGAGKTTLMLGALGLLPGQGKSSLTALPAAERARVAAWMPQTREIAWPVTVETLVGLGRIPHGGKGEENVNAALARLELESFRHRAATELSGGEQARALIARALAQDAPILMADEPIAGLDPAHQIATMQIFRSLAEEGRAVFVALHDLGLAVRYCTRLALLDKGRLVATGTPREVLTEANLRDIFGVRARFEDTADGPVFQVLERVA